MSAPSVTFTLDLEDHRLDQRTPPRYPAIVQRLMDVLDEHAARCTVFVVGNVARRSPALLRELAARGHEIAYHSHDHTALTHERADRFARETGEDRRFIEDLTGAPLLGFRAPVFSLTPQSLWSLDLLGELGFCYSSSVLPARNPLHGFPGAPRRPFRWPNGLLELPAPVARIGPLLLPFLGGFYLRYLPMGLVERLLRDADREQCLWTYCHPYDFDEHEPFGRIRGASLTVSTLLWFNRRGTLARLRRILERADAAPCTPFAEQLAAGRFEHAAEWAPT